MNRAILMTLLIALACLGCEDKKEDKADPSEKESEAAADEKNGEPTSEKAPTKDGDKDGDAAEPAKADNGEAQPAEKDDAVEPTETDGGEPAPGTATAGDSPADAGIVVEYRDPAPELSGQLAILTETRLIDDAAKVVSEMLVLPTQIKVVVGAEDGPLYDSGTKEIWINLEFLAETQELLAEAYPTLESLGVEAEGDNLDEAYELALASATLDAVEFAFYHEVGHALIDVLELPVVGKEEDAVDALATFLVTELYEEGADVALTNADLFGILAELEPPGDEDFWDEHSLDAQRFAAIVCWVYGSEPEAFDNLLEVEGMSDDRADLCVEDYGRMADSWVKLLEPHMKPEAKAETP